MSMAINGMISYIVDEQGTRFKCIFKQCPDWETGTISSFWQCMGETLMLVVKTNN